MLNKNASNQSGGTITDPLGCGTNSMQTYPFGGYQTTAKKTVRTTTTVREYNDQGNLVKETETIVEEEIAPTYTSTPQIFN